MGELAKWEMENTNVIVQETLQDLRAKSVSANHETFPNIWQLIKDFDFFAQAFLKFLISGIVATLSNNVLKLHRLKSLLPWNNPDSKLPVNWGSPKNGSSKAVKSLKPP